MYGRVEPRQLPGNACEECRRKKLRCDRQRPQCGACVSTRRPCKISNRRVRGASKKAAACHDHPRPPPLHAEDSSILDTLEIRPAEDHDVAEQLPGAIAPLPNWDVTGHEPGPLTGSSVTQPELEIDPSPTLSMNVFSPYSISTPNSLQSREAAHRNAPLSDLVKNDLVQLFLDRVHPNIPIVDRSKLHEKTGDVSEARQCRECLLDTIYMFAAAFSSQFSSIEHALYGSTRSALERLEAHGTDAEICHIEHVQAWILITYYEFSRMRYRRGWLSAGRVFRLVQLAKFSDLDGPGRAALQDGSDAAALEEKRRTFWAAYCLDRLISLSGDGPSTFDERMIYTRLPCPDVDFFNGLTFPEAFLPEAMSSADVRPHSQLAECAILLTLCGRILSLGHAGPPDIAYSTTASDLFVRHDWLDSMVSRRLDHLRANHPATAATTLDSMTIFLYMIAHSATVVLCNSVEALPRNEQNQALVWRFQERGLWAAQEIARLAKEHQHAGLFKAHTFTPLAIYLSATRLGHHLEIHKEELDARAVKGIEASRRMAHQSLQKLSSVNRLADHYLRMLDPIECL